MKSKLVFGLLVAMVALAITPASFAQVSLTINNTPSSQEIKTNRTVETSDPFSPGAGITVSGSLLAASPLSTTLLILTFPSTITSAADSSVLGAAFQGTTGNFNVPAGDPIRILGQTGVFLNATIYTRQGNQLQISLIGDTDVPANVLSGSFRIVGTRIEGNGLTAPAVATASLNNSANNFLLNTTSVTLITALGDGIASVTQGALPGTLATQPCGNGASPSPNCGPIVIFTNRSVPNQASSVLITEGFATAWRTQATNAIDATSPAAATGVGSTQIRLTFTGIPATSTITITGLTATTGTTVGLAAGAAAALNSTTNTTVVDFATTNLTAIDQVQVNFTISPPTSNPATGTITVTGTMFPVSTSTLSTNGYVPATATNAAGASGPVVPRFAATEVGPATVGNIVAATTTMLMPLVEKVGGFDTGISIANTTKDPFGTSGGGATETAGTISLNFFPATATGVGTPFSLTTSATVRPGLGLAADGTLPGGGTWRVLVSELLTAAGQSGDFVGYVFAQTNFLLAHGAATISDFRTYSLSAPMLVMAPPATVSRNNPNNSVESLNQ